MPCCCPQGYRPPDPLHTPLRPLRQPPARPPPAGNFLLLSKDEKAPLKAIDFGLAVFFSEKELPRTDLGLEGTPW